LDHVLVFVWYTCLRDTVDPTWGEDQMSAATGKASAYFRKSWRAIGIALTLGVVLGAVGWFAGERLGQVRPYLLFFGPFALGYAFGRTHQLADQREQHSDPRAPKGN